ncbi:hypothetical protein JXM83_06060 [Candidatus Woesearchaeota archaeon]|nr:hypothetical protein [Candidatus Woesearchaeota archaeon]
MSKKAQSMSLNVVIVAALALIVLVVLTAIFISRMNTSSEKVGQNDDNAFNNICMKPVDGYSQSKCVAASQCNTPWEVSRPDGGTATGAGNWLDCQAGSNTADPKVCCRLPSN